MAHLVAELFWWPSVCVVLVAEWIAHLVAEWMAHLVAEWMAHLVAECLSSLGG